MTTYYVVKRDASIMIVRSKTEPKGYYVTTSEAKAKAKQRKMQEERQWR